jgi:energy-coupling factor transport system substrate-specific component
MATSGGVTRVGAPPTTLVVALVPLAVAVNFVANWVAATLGLPIYLDTVGTFLASVLVGPWWGALVGVLTNGVGVLQNGASNALFAPVNVAAALIWGYGIRSFGLGRNAVTFFALAVVVGIVTGALAAPIVIFLGYATGHPSDLITASLLGFGVSLELAVLASSVLSSVADKVVSGYVGLALTAALPAAVVAGVVLPQQPGARRFAVALVGIVIGVAMALLVAVPKPA